MPDKFLPDADSILTWGAIIGMATGALAWFLKRLIYAVTLYRQLKELPGKVEALDARVGNLETTIGENQVEVIERLDELIARDPGPDDETAASAG